MRKDQAAAGSAALATPAPTATGRGTVLAGRYVLGEWLGRGAMAEVFAARDAALERPVAVKVFHQGAVLDDDARRAAEVRTLAGLSHPGLVTVFDAGRDTRSAADPVAFLVMELVEGTTLRQLVTNAVLPASEVADLGVQIASALAYVHGLGIVHRDIKPANIMVTDRQRSHDRRTVAKLTDFGGARWRDGARLTRHRTAFGTANYLSPEQATGADVTPASDMFSFGLVLVECLTGMLAYPGEGIAAVAVRLHRPPPIPHEFGPGWATLLRQLTHTDPARRPDPATAAQTLQALASTRAVGTFGHGMS